MRTPIACLVAVLAAAPALAANVDRTLPFPEGGVLSVEIPVGSVTIAAAEGNEIRITGTYSETAGEFDARAQSDGVHVEIDPRGGPNRMGGRAVLEIRVPASARLDLEGFSTDFTVRGTRGGVSVETLNGQVTVEAAAGEVRVEAINGKIEVRGAIDEAKLETAAGDIAVSGVRRSLSAESVSGKVDVTDSAVEEASLSSVSGTVRYAGKLASKGRMKIETVSGPVRLELPPDVAATFTIDTFSGELTSDFPSARVRSEHGPGREMRLVTGDGGFRVDIETFSAPVVLKSVAAK